MQYRLATKFRLQALLLVFGAFAAPLEAFGQAIRLPATIDCLEVVHASANDDLTAYASVRDAFALTFARQESGEYEMIGKLGSAELETVRGEGFTQFIELTPLGGVTLTTILSKSVNGSYTAVHSRHSVIGGHLVPSQTILSCSGR